MARAFQLGLEVAAGGPRPMGFTGPDELLAVADLAVAAGFEAIWVRDGYAVAPAGATGVAVAGAAGAPTDATGAAVADAAGAAGYADAVTLAGGLAAHTVHATIGVITDLVGGRHPAVLARDLLTLDVVSDGRAALLLCDASLCSLEGPTLGDPLEVDGPGIRRGSLDRLAEAASICRAMFDRADPPHGGRHFPVGHARSLLRRMDAGGPVLAVQIDCLDTGTAQNRTDTGTAQNRPDTGTAQSRHATGGLEPDPLPAIPLDQGLVACVAAADAIVTGVPSGELGAVRALIESACEVAGRPAAPTLIWRRMFTNASDGAVDPQTVGGLIARFDHGDESGAMRSMAAGWRAWGRTARSE